MLVLRIMIVALLVSSSAAWAAPLPWNDRPYSHFSDQEPLKDMLSALAASQKTPVIVSKAVRGVISAHFKEKSALAIFEEVVNTHGLIWYYDKEALYVYRKEEIKQGSVSMKKMSPAEFTAALQRLEVYDPDFKWEISEADNVISFNGPERYIDIVLDNAKLLDSKRKSKQQVYKWKDASGRVHYSTERPSSLENKNWDVRTSEKLPGVEVLDVIKE